MDTPGEAFRIACERAGGLVALAGLLNKTKQAVNGYKKGVPAAVCPLIEKHTGVRCEALRPDIEWGVLRSKKAKV